MVTKRCDNCMKDILASNFLPHSLYCHRNMKRCLTCKILYKRANKAEHIETEHIMVYCPGCNELIEKFALIGHGDVCSKRKIECEHCVATIVFDELDKHLDECAERTEKCQDCNIDFPYLELKEHTKECSEIHKQSGSMRRSKRLKKLKTIDEEVEAMVISNRRAKRSKNNKKDKGKNKRR